MCMSTITLYTTGQRAEAEGRRAKHELENKTDGAERDLGKVFDNAANKVSNVVDSAKSKVREGLDNVSEALE
jgi:hypothetical protein